MTVSDTTSQKNSRARPRLTHTSSAFGGATTTSPPYARPPQRTMILVRRLGRIPSLGSSEFRYSVPVARPIGRQRLRGGSCLRLGRLLLPSIALVALLTGCGTVAHHIDLDAARIAT